MDRWTTSLEEQIDGQTGGWMADMDGWRNGWMKRWMDAQTDRGDAHVEEQMDTCTL